MTIRNDSSRSLPFVEAFSARDRAAAESALARRDEQRRQSFEGRDRATSKLAANLHARVRGLRRRGEERVALPLVRELGPGAHRALTGRQAPIVQHESERYWPSTSAPRRLPLQILF
jgi:hypothetical protein